MLSAMKVVEKEGQPFKVDHPLLDKVRACSANPDKAADFFLWILHPIRTWRLSAGACLHPYLKPTYLRMLDEFPLPESHPCGELILEKPIADGDYMEPGGLCLKMFAASMLCDATLQCWNARFIAGSAALRPTAEQQYAHVWELCVHIFLCTCVFWYLCTCTSPCLHLRPECQAHLQLSRQQQACRQSADAEMLDFSKICCDLAFRKRRATIKFNSGVTAVPTTALQIPHQCRVPMSCL